MRVFIVGATGVLGRATAPHLAGHACAGTTRSSQGVPALRALGLEPVVCDAYDRDALAVAVRRFAPDVVANFLTDLRAGPGPANTRLRREACPNVTAAARRAGVRRLVVESIAFSTNPDSTGAVSEMERDALDAGLAVVVLRFGRFWGPGTWHTAPPEPPAIEVGEAGRRAAALIMGNETGIVVVAGS
jgi:nucleoside-diphosphate-sugar epimerase